MSEDQRSVEGIDPIQCGTFQALQQYRLENNEWTNYAEFSPCLSVQNLTKSRNRMFMIDVYRYHDIVPNLDAAEQAGEESKKSGRTARLEAIKATTLAAAASTSTSSDDAISYNPLPS